MTYFEGFVAAVPEANKEAYRKHAADAAPIFQEFGVKRHIEAWDSDVHEGKVTDFYRAVKAEDGEKIVFSFIEWPDKAKRDEAWGKIMADESLKPEGDMPFSGQRMFWGGFEPIFDTARQREPADA